MPVWWGMKAESYLGLLLVVWSVLSAAMSLPATPKAVGNPAQSQTGIVEEIVAKVNGRIITRSELDQRRESSHASAGEALRDQIDELLLRERAVELNLNADAEVNKKIAEYQRESGIADPDKFHEWVRQNSGESFENLRESIRNGVLRQRVIGEEVYRGLESSIATADMQSYYESHRDDFVRQESVSLREIQIAAPDQSGAAERKAKALAERISKGEKFSELAAQYSDNAASAPRRGIPGNFPAWRSGGTSGTSGVCAPEGVRDRTDSRWQSIRNSESGREDSRRAGDVRRSAWGDSGYSGHASAAGKASRLPDEPEAGCVFADQTGLCRQRCGAGSRH